MSPPVLSEAEGSKHDTYYSLNCSEPCVMIGKLRSQTFMKET